MVLKESTYFLGGVQFDYFITKQALQEGGIARLPTFLLCSRTHPQELR